MKQTLRIGLLLAVVALVYGNSLANSFTLDDALYVTNNPQVAHASLRGLFSANPVSNVFRPMTFATLALNWKLGGEHPFGYHLINLLLHAAVALLLYLLLLELFTSFFASETEASPIWRDVAFGAALLFAVLPIHTEAVASIVGRAELLAAGFLFAGWILHLHNRPIAALFCFGLALFSKESAVVFMPLVALCDYARGEWKPRSRYAVMGGLTAVYLAVLWKVQGGRFGQLSIAKLDNPLASLPARWRILNAAGVAWRYVALQAYPAKLSCDYSFNQIPVHLDWLYTLPAALAAGAAVAMWLWAVSKRRSGLITASAIAGAIYLAGFAVTANVLVPTGTIMAERLAYLPSAGFCLLAALAWSWLSARRRTAALALAAVTLTIFAVRTAARNRDWRDNLALFESGVRAAPNSAKMHADLGYQYLFAGRLDLAGPQLEAALRIEPDYPDALGAYGLLQDWLGNYQVAGGMMERALSMSTRADSNYDFMAVNLAAVMMQTGHEDGALDLLNREIAESPRYSRAWSNRAVIRYRRGDAAPARTDAQQALLLDPANAQAQSLLRRLDEPADTAARK